MTREQIQTYTLRVSQASPCELIVILYDIILDDVNNAKEALASGDNKQYQTDLSHAVRVVNELMEALDFSEKISYRLMSLYIYVAISSFAETKDTLNLLSGVATTSSFSNVVPA